MTQLGIRSESVGAGDQSWLGSRHGTETPKSATLDPTAWTSKTTAGVIKSGEAFALVSGLAVPYNSAGSGGTNVLAGFILTNQSVVTGAGNVTFPAVWHGRIILSKLPSVVAADATTTGLFVLEA
ncbi:potassium transporter [Mycolicibacterium peregrinum]|uniref:potassium transporter n=1 Tax=Mycolicibacterium peregrinum TaxID=43304 RepID=UPI003AAAE6D1